MLQKYSFLKIRNLVCVVLVHNEMPQYGLIQAFEKGQKCFSKGAN